MISIFLNCIDKALDTYSTYDVLLAGDFNAEDVEPCLSNFLYQHDLYILVNDITLLMISGKMTEHTVKNWIFSQNAIAWSILLFPLYKLTKGKFLSLCLTGQGILQEYNLGIGSHVSITIRQIFRLLT